MLEARDIDNWSEFVLTRLLAEGGSACATVLDLVARMADQAPRAPALAPILPLSMAAAAVEAMLADRVARARVADTWRLAALIGAEVLAMQSERPDRPPPDVAALRDRLREDPAILVGPAMLGGPVA